MDLGEAVKELLESHGPMSRSEREAVLRLLMNGEMQDEPAQTLTMLHKRGDGLRIERLSDTQLLDLIATQESTQSPVPKELTVLGSTVQNDTAICRTRTSHNIVRFFWETQPTTSLLVYKHEVSLVEEKALQVFSFLRAKGMRVCVEDKVLDRFPKAHPLSSISPEAIDFVVCLGGDGTLLWTSSLFPSSVPPVISFSMGRLGFLTSHAITEAEQHLATTLEGGFYLTLRSRLICDLYEVPASTAADQRSSKKRARLVDSFTALNEVAIDRGHSTYISDLLCYCDGHLLTKARADGLVLSTATGSTAYSLSAGGSLMHPQVHGILLTPVCPHSLSFRPIILPEASRITIQLAPSSRSSAWVACDGLHRRELCFNNYIEVRTSSFPLPGICLQSETKDWLRAVQDGLHWNKEL